MLHLHSPTLPSFLFPLLTCPLIGSFHILHAPPSSMAFSPFLSAVSHSSADLASVDFDWLPDSSIKLWNSEVSNSCGDGSPTSPPQPLTFRRPTNRFLLDQSFGLLNPSLQTTNNLLHRTFSSSSSSPPPPAAESLVSRPLFPAGDFKVRMCVATNEVLCGFTSSGEDSWNSKPPTVWIPWWVNWLVHYTENEPQLLRLSHGLFCYKRIFKNFLGLAD